MSEFAFLLLLSFEFNAHGRKRQYLLCWFWKKATVSSQRENIAVHKQWWKKKSPCASSHMRCYSCHNTIHLFCFFFLLSGRDFIRIHHRLFKEPTYLMSFFLFHRCSPFTLHTFCEIQGHLVNKCHPCHNLLRRWGRGNYHSTTKWKGHMTRYIT